MKTETITRDGKPEEFYLKADADRKIHDLVALLQRCVAASPKGSVLPKGQLRTTITSILTERYFALTTEPERRRRRAHPSVKPHSIHDPEA